MASAGVRGMGPVFDRGGPGIGHRPASVACAGTQMTFLDAWHMQPRGEEWAGTGRYGDGPGLARRMRRDAGRFYRPPGGNRVLEPAEPQVSRSAEIAYRREVGKTLDAEPVHPGNTAPRPGNTTAHPGSVVVPPPETPRSPARLPGTGIVLRWPETGSNCRPSTFQADALPTELSGQRSCLPAFSATLKGLEPSTSAVTGRRANQLRHRAMFCCGKPRGTSVPPTGFEPVPPP